MTMQPIAIIGIAGLFPGTGGDSDALERFWDNLRAGKRLTQNASAAQFGADAAYFFDASRTAPDTSYYVQGGYIDGFRFDPSGFALAADDLRGLGDPFQWALHVGRGALKDSGYWGHPVLMRAGVILGNLTMPTRASGQLLTPLYHDLLDKALKKVLSTAHFALNPSANERIHIANALSPGAPASVLASALGLGGVRFALDAACGSSLYAVGLACDWLNTGRADLMLAGAVSAADPLFVNMGFAHLGGFPDPGRDSLPLDSESDGLIAGEGAGIVVLKRLADARRDGDRIYGVIRGVGLANDGAGKHILTPNSKGQVLAFERAYADAGIHPAQVGYVECHASGTPLGDRTEIQSMRQFFGEKRPRIGSVKSNVGHLMTTAGMTSLTKLILALAHEEIPATIQVTYPTDGDHVSTRPLAWKRGDNARLAGINAFGFGGVSAHLLLSDEHESNPVTTQSDPSQPVRMAITGMDAHFGKFETLDAFTRAAFDGETAFRDLPAPRWKGLDQHADVLARFGLDQVPQGAYIESFDLDFMAMKIPPNPNDEPIPQQLLLLKVADAAIRDAGLQAGGNVAVLVALGTDLSLHQYRGRAELNYRFEQALAQAELAHLPAETRAHLQALVKDSLLSPAQVNHYTSYIGNIAASRVASLWDFNGPAYTVAAEENSVFRALEIAQVMLEKNDVDAVVIGAVDLAGGLESVLIRNALAKLHRGTPAAGFDAAATGWMVGEGAGAIVVTRAERGGQNAYAVIDALTIQQAPTPGTPTADVVAGAMQSALNRANLRPSEIGYLALHSSGIDAEDSAEIDAITRVYRGTDEKLTALGAVKASVGHTFIASGMASLIQAAAAVAYRFIPAVPNWNQPERESAWANTPFWVAHKARTWFDSSRHAAVNGLSLDGSAAHLILSDAAGSARKPDILRGGIPALILVDGRDANSLLSGLKTLRAQLDAHGDLVKLADDAFHRADAHAPLTLVLVAKSADDLRKEIDRAEAGIPDALRSGKDWSTPAGSFFSPRPVGGDGGIAFVYPGAFNSYPKMGYELFHLFPHTLDALHAIKSKVPEAVSERLLYPRSLEKPSVKLTRQMKLDLAEDAVATIESGIAFAVAYSRAMQDVFGLHPRAAFGYSLGEGSMMWGMGVWRDGDAGSAAFRRSDLFTKRLVDPMLAIREAWGIAPDVPTDAFWTAYFIAAPVETVKAAIDAENRVYLTHINTPTEVMIAGDPAACQRVVERVGGESMQAPFTVLIHAEVMVGEYGEFYRLHDLPVTPIEGVTFYSAADYAPVKLERHIVAGSISRMTCKPIDFPRLVRAAYADGVRVFIELGPRSTCARWVSESLGESPHVSVSIDNMSTDSRTALIRMLAALAAHRVPMDLSPLFNHPAQTSGKSLVRTVRLGGDDIYKAIIENAPSIDSVPRQATPQPIAQAGTPTSTLTNGTPLPAGLHAVHTEFLQARQDALRHMAELIAAQMSAGATDVAIVPQEETALALPPIPAPDPEPPPSLIDRIRPLYNYDDIETFALRRIADTFGERYAIYDGRRAPRVPNGDLLLISRIIRIEGERYKSVTGTNVLTEYDVPVDAWYFRDSPYPTMPYAVLMEIALQPCGILSAYHGPTFAYPDADLYFRNLDGDGALLIDKDMRGRTIVNHVTLLSSASLGGTILQKFSFNLYDGDDLFYTGTATFGYFTQESLASRAGLDAGESRPRWNETHHPVNVTRLDPATLGAGYARLGRGQLALVDFVEIVPDGGHYEKGYAYARTTIDPTAWFFKNHFHEDPVMPGSIGVETMLEALQAYAIHQGYTTPRSHFTHPADSHKVVWRYRGQVQGHIDYTHVEVNIKEVRHNGNRTLLIGDASLWRDSLRIYEVTDLALAIEEG